MEKRKNNFIIPNKWQQAIKGFFEVVQKFGREHGLDGAEIVFLLDAMKQNFIMAESFHTYNNLNVRERKKSKYVG